MDNVIFGSEWDNSGFLKSINSTVAGYQTLLAKQNEVNQSMAVTDQRLKDNDENLKKATKTAKEYENSTTAIASKQTELNSRVADLKKNHDALTASYAQQQKQLNDMNRVYANATAAINNVATSQKQLAQTFSTPITPQVDIDRALGQLDKLKQGLGGALMGGGANLGSVVNASSLQELNNVIINSKQGFDEVADSLNTLEEKLGEVPKGSAAFEELNSKIAQGKDVIRNFTDVYNKALADQNQSTEDTGTHLQSYRQQLMAVRKELTSLEQAGKDNTEEYRSLQMEAAKLEHHLDIQTAKIRILASETKAFDFGLATVKAATAGYEVYLGVMNSLGIADQNAEEAQKKLLAIMVLVNGAQELYEAFSKKSVIVTLAQSAATKGLAAIEGALAVATNLSAAAASNLSKALLATGIGALVVGIGFLVAKIIEWNDESEKANHNQELLNAVGKEAAKNSAEQVAKLELIRSKLTDLSIPQKERLALAKQYNETADAGNKIDLTQINNLDMINAKITEQIALIEKRAFAKAAENKISEAAEKVLIEEEKLRDSPVQKKIDDANLQLQKLLNAQTVAEANSNTGTGKGLMSSPTSSPEIDAVRKKLQALKQEYSVMGLGDELKKARDEFQNELKLFSQYIDVGSLLDPKKTGAVIQNVYLQRLAELKERLTNIQQAATTTYATIQAKVKATQDKDNEQITRDLKEGRLTKVQASDLRKYVGLISDAELTKEYADYNQKRHDLDMKIDAELMQLRQQATEKRIGLIQDDIQREAATIDNELTKSISIIEQQRQTKFDELQKNFLAGLFGDPKSALAKTQLGLYKQEYSDMYDQLIEELKAESANKKQDLGAKQFQKVLDSMNRDLADAGLNISQAELRQLQAEAQLYLKGQISYETYQKSINKIAEKYTQQRLQTQKDALQAEVNLIEARLNEEDDLSDKEIKDLTDKERSLNEQILGIDKQLTSDQTKQHKEQQDEKLKEIKDITDSYSTLANSILNYLSVINNAETASLDRSIALQQKRVDNAKDLANKGNAQYLEIEQKRLDALQQKREDAARKQLAIDNALRLSQATVAAVTAIAQAVATGSVFAGIAAAAAVIGAIASAYSFVQSLQPQSANFNTGTEYVTGQPGIDKVPANLTVGEAVIPEKHNREYRDTVSAIYNKRVPAKVMNDFVANYSIGATPMANYDRLAGATTIFMEDKVNTHRQLSTLNDTMQQVGNKLDKFEQVRMSFDEHGFGLAMIKTAKAEKLRFRA